MEEQPKPAATRTKAAVKARDEALLAMIVETAEAGAVMPTNMALRNRFGRTSTAPIVDSLKRLIDAGRIIVTRTNDTRVVTVVATGKSTANRLAEREALYRERQMAADEKVAAREAARQLKAAIKESEAPPAPEVPVMFGSPSPFRTCQWIDGEPSADDACKCGQPTHGLTSYCEPHAKRVIVPRPPVGSRPGVFFNKTVGNFR